MLFISLQVSDKFIIETGSLVYTSMIIVLPLGTLIAQRLADPAAFNSEGRSNAGNSNVNAVDPHDFSSSGKKPLIPSWNRDGNITAMFSGGRGSKDVQGKTGVVASVTSDHFHNKGSDAVDMELAQIDNDGDIEAGRVRVNRQLQQSEEML